MPEHLRRCGSCRGIKYYPACDVCDNVGWVEVNSDKPESLFIENDKMRKVRDKSIVKQKIKRKIPKRWIISLGVYDDDN